MNLSGLLISLAAAFLPVQKISPQQAGGRVPVLTTLESELAYKAGENLTYSMHYEWGLLNADVGIGSVALEREEMNGTPVFHCTVEGQTVKKYDWVLKVRENFQSWFTCNGIQPWKFTCYRSEGKYLAKNSFNYKWLATPARIEADVYTPKRGQRRVQIPLDDKVFDLPSLFYFARNMDFDSVQPDVKYPMSFVIDDDIYNVHFILLGRETIKVKGLGQVKTIKFAADLIEGEVFKSDQDMTIWVSDDKNRVPVQFVAPIKIGVASGRLKDYSGLKYPFTALIQK
ncbi:MAG: DUF3108 domain-containing protein [Bacteroidales bacterium]|nr:DUF3108 domain-containing protein [Bacteroidales bacterium]